MKTQYYAAMSLDGFVAGRGHDLDWLLQFGDVEGTSYPSFIAEVGALAMGSVTYEWVLGHAKEVQETVGSSWPYTQPTWVFTTRELPTIPGADVRFVQGDVRPVHAAMAEEAGRKNLWIVGGGELAGQFHDAGLLDELILQVTAVTLGEGIPAFPRSIVKPPLRLLSAERFGSAFVEIRYAVPKPGDLTPSPRRTS